LKTGTIPIRKAELLLAAGTRDEAAAMLPKEEPGHGRADPALRDLLAQLPAA